MQEHEYKARDKTVQKMSRDGLREKNLRSKKEKRITGREADEKKIAGHKGTGAGLWKRSEKLILQKKQLRSERRKTQTAVQTRFSGTGRTCGSGRNGKLRNE